MDEAHATGVFGRRGAGVVEQLGLERQVHVRIGTLSKALGCSGGFVSGSRPLIDWLINRSRPYIFSTASPAANSSAALAALDIVRDEPGRRPDLLAAAADLRNRLREQGWNVPGGVSPIIPVIVGQPQRALELAASLRARGFWVPAIRPPSVPAGESCLRVTVCHSHGPETLAALVEAFASLR